VEDLELDRSWKDIIETMNDGLMVVGPDGVIRLANRALEEMTGYTEAELIGRSCLIFNCDACEKARQEGGRSWCRLFEGGQPGPRRRRCLLQRKDGTYLPALKNASLLRDAQGRILGAVETLTDVSESLEQEDRIRALSRRLDDSPGFHGLIGQSAAMRRVFEIVRKAALSEAPVIIYGESGTGKELVAAAIHDLGRRKEGPFIQLNCAALNESLLESELFGHVKGAFTGAFRHRVGRFEAAHGGDIFLDEIGDMPLSIQVKLLRVLETKQFERVGEQRPIPADVRVIAATHRDLSRMVAENAFRQDLFFRINVIPILLPPLRERPEDLALLVEHFLGLLNRSSGKKIAGVTPEAMELLRNYGWPGNVRELRSALEYAFVLAEGGLIRPDQLPPHLERPAQRPGVGTEPAASKEKAALIEALRRSGGNQSQAARLLGVSRVTVWNRMRKHGLDLKKVVAS